MKLVIVPGLRPKRLILATKPIGLRRPVDEVQQPLRLEGLFDEVDSTFADRRDGRVQVPVSGDHQDRQVRVAALYFLKDLEAVETRALKPDVEQHERRASF